ncbi:MAG: sugar nucleotide-binding protein [Xanthomonadaceae bacterium]|nr:sugar nucleotide-binding protein [Xanthomonadaceae bacterium]
MATKAVLVIGGSGFLGTHICQKLRETHKVFATYYAKPISLDGVSFLPLDLYDRESVKRLVYKVHPDCIVYAGGNPSFFWAEKNSQMAERLHAGGPSTVAAVSEVFQSRFIFLSNPYVFDGKRGNYNEQDTVLPGTVLGKAKLTAENFLSSRSLNYVIIRSSPVFGRGNGYTMPLVDLLRTTSRTVKKIELSDYKIHSYAPVQGLTDLVSRAVDGAFRNKILHYGGLTKMSSYQFAKEFCKRFGLEHGHIAAQKAKPDEFKRSTGDPTVFDYSVNTSQTIELLKIKPFLLEEGFDLFEKDLIGTANLT